MTGNDRIILGSGGQNVVLGDNGEIDYTNSGQVLSGLLQNVAFGNVNGAGTITLTDGERIETIPGSLRARIVRFREQTIPVVLPPPVAAERRLSEVPTLSLVGSAVSAERVELQQRGGWPVMTLVLAACAVPLSRLRPRQGRFSRVWLAVLLFALYANLLQVAGVWLERGATPDWLGLWWVHALFISVALLLARRPRPRRRMGA